MTSKGWADPANIASHAAVCKALKAMPRRTLRDIAKEFGISPQRVSVIARDNDLRRKALRCDAKPKPSKGVLLTEIGLMRLRRRNAVILALYAGESLTSNKIARLLGMKAANVWHVVRRYGAEGKGGTE